MKEYIRAVSVQMTAIFLAALGAGLLAFFTSVATSLGATCSPTVDPVEVGSIGALIKALHSAILAGGGRIG